MDQYSEEELPKMITPEHVHSMPGVADHVLQMMKRTSPVGAAAALRGRAERIDYTPLLAEIRVPVLILVGERDCYTPISDARFMHERIRDSSLVVIDRAGHMPNRETPEVFNSALSTFLAKVFSDAFSIEARPLNSFS